MSEVVTRYSLHKQPAANDAQLAAHKPSKLGQTDLVFGLWSEFIRRSVRARLQVSTCSSLDLRHHG